jgi:hypothetical protein
MKTRFSLKKKHYNIISVIVLVLIVIFFINMHICSISFSPPKKEFSEEKTLDIEKLRNADKSEIGMDIIAIGTEELTNYLKDKKDSTSESLLKKIKENPEEFETAAIIQDDQAMRIVAFNKCRKKLLPY